MKSEDLFVMLILIGIVMGVGFVIKLFITGT